MVKLSVYSPPYVTGHGFNPLMSPYDRRSGSDNESKPWPGYIVGGDSKATAWNDKQEDYTTNEIAINWQAALAYALAAFVEK